MVRDKCLKEWSNVCYNRKTYAEERVPKTIKVIVFINVMVFLSWLYSMTNFGALKFMAENFLVSWNALLENRFWVLITSVFSHNAFFHLFINMYVLIGFGSILLRFMNPLTFLNFYFTAGLMGSFAHAFLSNVLMNSPEIPALGASGAIAGIILLFSLLFPKEKLLLLGIIPVRAIWGALIVVGVDMWGLIAQSKGGGLNIGHGAHLGGAFMGVIWYLYYRFKLKRLRSLYEKENQRHFEG